MPAIFISHSSLDQKIADDIKNGAGEARIRAGLPRFRQGYRHRRRRELGEAALRGALALPRGHPGADAELARLDVVPAELSQARALGKVILPVICAPLGDRYVLPEMQAVDLVDWNAGGLERLEQRLRAIANELARGFRLDPNRPPYPGHPCIRGRGCGDLFRPRQRDPHCHREAGCPPHPGRRAVADVIGASGSGKSSLLKAGVLPQLTRRSANGSCFRRSGRKKRRWKMLAKSIAQQTGKADTGGAGTTACRPAAADQVDELLKDLRIGESPRRHRAAADRSVRGGLHGRDADRARGLLRSWRRRSIRHATYHRW